MKKLIFTIILLLFSIESNAQLPINVTGLKKPTGGGAAFDKEFNFRATSGFVTDGVNATYVLGSADLYPTNRNLVTFGWTSAISMDSRDRSTGVDVRVAGMNFTDSLANTFIVDLPSTGTYRITLAMGDQANPQTVQWEIFDNTTSRSAHGPISTGGSNRYVDAAGTVRTSDSDWATNNVKEDLSFTSTTFKITLAGGTVTIAHLRITKL